MGYNIHHAIVVTSFGEDYIELAHRRARELFVATGPFNETLAQVTEVTPPSVNSYQSFMVAPDGSKEGWGTSDEGDKARSEFVAWLRKCPDVGIYLDWVEIQYGEDDHAPAKIVNENHDEKSLSENTEYREEIAPFRSAN